MPEVTGSHAYATGGTFTVQVTVHDVGTSSATATSRDDVESAVAQSGTQVYVEAAYNAQLGRAADPSGLAYWVGKIEGGASRGSFAEALIHSDEYYAAQVRAAYQQVLQRAADATGTSRSGVAAALLGGVEGQTAMLADDYFHFLGRTPDEPGQTYWLMQLANGIDANNIAASMVASAEYFRRVTAS